MAMWLGMAVAAVSWGCEFDTSANAPRILHRQRRNNTGKHVFVLQMRNQSAQPNNHSLTRPHLPVVISAVRFAQKEIHQVMTMSDPTPIDRPLLERLVRALACKIVTGDSDLNDVVERTFAIISRTAPQSSDKYEYAGQLLRIAIDQALLLRDRGRPDTPLPQRQFHAFRDLITRMRRASICQSGTHRSPICPSAESGSISTLNNDKR